MRRVLHRHQWRWVFAPDGSQIGISEMPKGCANVAFGGPDVRTLLLTASTSVYTLRVGTPGLPPPALSQNFHHDASLACQLCGAGGQGTPGWSSQPRMPLTGGSAASNR